jgi:hypothetical protein
MTDNTGNEPQPNIVINIDTAYNVNPAAKEVNNTFIIGAKEGKEAIAEALCTKNATFYMGEPEEKIDCMPIRKEILNYVSRVRPLLTDEAKSDYMKVWEDILDLREVEALVYKPGKQKGTNFNRDLVANILYFLRNWKIYRVVYKQDYNGAALTEALEQDKEHSVKHALRDDPPQDIRDAITAMMKRKHELWP